MKKLLLLIITIVSLPLLGKAQGTNCSSADPFCTGSTYTFANSTGVPDAGPMGCLQTTPNPAWYYMEIDQSGTMQFTISQTSTGGSAIDVDFAMWGPYASTSAACTDISGGAFPIQSSWDNSTVETAGLGLPGGSNVNCYTGTGGATTPPPAVAGEVYLIMLTNFSDDPGYITFAQTNGTGSSDCSIVTPSCPTVGFHGEDSGGNSYTLPLTLDCTTDGWLFLRANDASQAGGPITPTAVVNVATNGNSSGNNIYGYENNSGTWNNYWSATNITSNTNYSFTMYEMDNVTASSFGIEMCDVTSGSDMSFTIQDGNCGNATITTGTWSANDGTSSGSAGPTGNPSSGGCQFVTFPTSAVSGTATYSCPSCPPSSFVATSYGWAYFNPAEAGPGSYNITYSWDDGCGCSGSATETITVNNPYDATFSYASSSYCQSSSDPTPTISGTTGGAFTSSPAGLSINGSSGVIDVSASTPGNYTVTYTVGGGATDYSGNCNASSGVPIQIVSNPVANAGSSASINCTTPTATLSGSGGGSYSWAASGGGNIVSGGSTATPTVDAAGTYTLTVTNGGCTDTDAVTVTADFTAPTAGSSTAGVIDCNNTTTTVTGTGGGTYSWSGPGIVSGGSSATATVNAAGSYTVTVTGANGCTATSSTTVSTDLTPPTAGSSVAGVIDCNNATTTVTGTGGGTYSWSGPGIVSGGSSATATVNAAGSYTVTVTGANGCTATSSTTVSTDLTPPTADAGSDVTTTCTTSTATLSGSASGGTSPYTYSWDNGIGAVQNPTVDPASTTTYTLTVTGANGCTDTDDVMVTVDETAPTADAGSDATTTCTTSTATLSGSASGGTSPYTYSWDNGIGAVQNPTVDPASTTTYTLTVTGANGCTDTDDVMITVDETAPTADAGSDVLIDCNSPGGQETLDGSGSTSGMSYAWTTSGGNIVSGASSNTATVDANGTYTITVTNSSNGCSSSDDAIVTSDFSTPTASVANPAQIDCVTPSTTVDGSASTNTSGNTTGLTYSWTASNGGVISGSTTGSSCTATSAGDYTLTVTQTNGCTDSQTVTVTADANLPSAVITGNATLTCSTTSITLDGSSSTGSSLSYEWQDGTNTSIGSSTTQSVNTPDTYTLIVTNTSNSCTNSTSVIVSQDLTTPNVVVISPMVVDCNNPVAMLDGSGSDQGSNYTYTWSNSGSGTILGAGNADTDSTSTADTYTLTVENTSNGCSDFADIVVNMDTVSPSANAGSDVSFPCGVSTVALDGSASSGTGIFYSWTGPGTITNGTSATPDVDGTGTFTLTVTGSNGCTDTDDVDVIPDSNAPVADAGTDITVTCNDLPWNVTLDGSGSDSGANFTYSWSTTGSGTITGGTTTAPSVDQAGAYTITVTNTSNSCTASATVNVLTDTISPSADAGQDQIITCNSGLVTTLDGINSSGNNITYNWTTSNGTIDSQSNNAATVSSAGDYDLTVTSDNGCTDTDQVTVTMDTLAPTVLIASPDSLDCQGTPVVLDGSGSSGSNETYLWSNSGTNNTTSVTASGTYVLTVTNDNGCSASDSVTVINVTGPIADFTGTPTSGNIPLIVDFIDNSSGSNLSYSWDFGDNNTSTQQNPSNTYSTVGSFDVILIVTDDNGCFDADSLTITTDGESVLIIPNIFSPNGDGNNDVFNVQGTNISEIQGTILNRWGQVVYEFDAVGSGWDGHTISGAEASAGTYYYLIDAIGADGKEYSYQGALELVR